MIEEPLYFYREVENVTKIKMIKGYNTQISVINKYYKGVINKKTKDRIIFKFILKKLIVFILDFFKLMFILEKKRVDSVSFDEIRKYNNLLSVIDEVGN